MFEVFKGGDEVIEMLWERISANVSIESRGTHLGVGLFFVSVFFLIIFCS